MKMDASDRAILDVLMKDGRASLREVAARTSLTTPTVSARLARMQRAGLIRGFVPVLDPAMTREVRAFVRLRVPTREAEMAARSLARLPEVGGVFLTIGGGNLMISLSASDLAGVEGFVGRRLAPKGWEVVSTEVVETAVKDERMTKIPEEVILPLRCDYCGQDIKTERPFNIRVGLTRHYFCCKTCRKSYLADHRGQIEIARRRAKRAALRS